MADMWDRMYQQFGARCVYCGRDLLEDVDAYMAGVLDHLIPTASLSENTDENKVLSCATCNTLKGNHDPRQGESGVAKEQLIERARARVFECRAEKARDFLNYLKKHSEGGRNEYEPNKKP